MGQVDTEQHMPAIVHQEIVAVAPALPADQYPAAVYIAALGSGSRRAMKGALNVIASILTGGRFNASEIDWSQLRYQHTAAIRAQLAERYAPSSANKMLAALRGVLATSWRLGQMNAEDYHRAVDVPTVRGSALPKGRCLRTKELADLFDACAADPTPLGRRDAALIAVAFGAGLRRAEIVGLDIGNYDLETGALTIRGKGAKERMGYCTNGSRDALDEWLDVRGDQQGPLFCPIRRGGHVAVTRRLDSQSVYDVLRRRAEEAGVATFSPHDARRTFISELLDAGAGLTETQQLAGHASPKTTSNYDRRGERAKKRAAALLHVPFQRRETRP